MPFIAGITASIIGFFAWIAKKIAVSVIGTAIQGFLTSLYITAMVAFIYFLGGTVIDMINLLYSIVDLINPVELANKTGGDTQTLICMMSASECLGINHGLRLGLNLFISNILLIIMLNTYKIPLFFIKNISEIIGGTINAAK